MRRIMPTMLHHTCFGRAARRHGHAISVAWLARDAGCDRPQYYDVHAGKCVTPVEHGCAAVVSPGWAWGALLLLARRRRGFPENTVRDRELC